MDSRLGQMCLGFRGPAGGTTVLSKVLLQLLLHGDDSAVFDLIHLFLLFIYKQHSYIKM